MLFDPNKWKMPEVPVRESDLVEVLKGARARVAHRWCCKGASDDDGGVCVIVAISRAAGEIAKSPPEHDRLFDKAVPLFERAIQPPDNRGLFSSLLSRPEHVYTIPWNEAADRTQGQVVAAFDRAIELARKDTRNICGND